MENQASNMWVAFDLKSRQLNHILRTPPTQKADQKTSFHLKQFLGNLLADGSSSTKSTHHCRSGKEA